MSILSSEFQPDWYSSPGDTILDILSEREIPILEFSERMGQTLDATKNLLEGNSSITISVAKRLHENLGASVEFWMNRDFQYHQGVAKIKRELATKEWVAQLPVKDMMSFGWLPSWTDDFDLSKACLEYFNVLDLDSWTSRYSELYAFRTSPSFKSNFAAVAAWLRQGEIQAENIDCNNWNREGFRDSLSQIRELTRLKDPKQFLPKLEKICSAAGVAVTIVRAPNGCRASGATRFISSTKALLLLSFRHLSDDHFWFTFFHEAGHLVLHSDKRLFLEEENTFSSREEDEANRFAEGILIPDEFRSEFFSLPIQSKDVIKFARKIGVSPGIIVGQLQHFQRISFRQLNSLKRRYQWKE
jgi:Zn-dependent peptidase ImmA (M78 family)/plasmid maintenance system antidote protein VapI